MGKHPGFVGLLESSQAPNYIEHRLESPDGKRVIVTLQKWDGKTPHELRKQAEQERDRERARAEKAEQECIERGKDIVDLHERAIAAEAALTAAREKVKGLQRWYGSPVHPGYVAKAATGDMLDRSEVLAALGVES